MRRIKKLSIGLMIIGLLLQGAYVHADSASGSAVLLQSAEVDGDTAALSGIHTGGAGKRVTLLVTDATGKPVCLDQTTSGEDGAYAFLCRLPKEGYGAYVAKVGGDEASAVALTFDYLAPSGGGQTGGGDGGSPGNGEEADANVVLKPTVTGRTAVASLSLEGAQRELPAGAGGPKKPLRIEVAMTEQIDSVNVKLPADLFKPAWRDRLSEVRIETQFGEVRIRPNAIPALKDGSTENVLAIGPADAGEGLTAYAFTLSVDGQLIGGFNGNRAVRVSIPYELATGNRPETIVVYYVDDDGSRTLVRDGHYDEATGTVVFYAKHFSVYAAASVDVEEFLDAQAMPWAESAISGLAARKVVKGTGNSRFEPQRAVTRAEFVSMLAQALEWSADDEPHGYPDVPAGSWYEAAVAAAARYGIATGYPDGTFGGTRTITRQEMAVMIARAMRSSGREIVETSASEPKDLVRVAAFAKDDVLALFQAGIVQGDAARRFNPAANSTRAEAAVVIYRLLLQP